MKKAVMLLFAIAGLAVMFGGTVESKATKAERIYFVRGQDYIRADGTQAFTIEHEVSYFFDPRDDKELKRHKAAATLALDAIAGPEPLEPTPEAQAKYHPDCPQYQDGLLVSTGPIYEPAPEDCSYGSPGPCSSIKTKDMFDCWGPPTNCHRDKKR